MKLDTRQERIVYGKSVGYSMIKGSKNTGKTTIGAYKTLYLENNYCIYDKDKILVVTENEVAMQNFKDIYEREKIKHGNEFITLFSNNKEKVDFFTLKDLYEIADKKLKKGFKKIDKEASRNLLKEALSEIKLKYPKLRILKEDYLDFFLDEIEWINSCDLASRDEYLEVKRIGRKYEKGTAPSKLSKNSMQREAIFELREVYNKLLHKNKFVDSSELIKLSTGKSEKSSTYTHIIIDNVEKFRKIELQLIQSFYKDEDYSNFIFLRGIEKNPLSMGFLIKSRKLSSLNNNIKSKNYNLKKIYTKIETLEKDKEEICFKEEKISKDDFVFEHTLKSSSNDFMENYSYKDLRHNKIFNFSKDISDFSEIIIREEKAEDDYSIDSLKAIPVYNDIAAGEPIMINDEQEGSFYLPEPWLKGIKDCFMLKVKGDSMINADIHNGDFVLIRKQNNASHGNIVAADIHGSATLKRLSIEENGAFLKPENPKYDPIEINEEGVYILGVAIGVLKNNN